MTNPTTQPTIKSLKSALIEHGGFSIRGPDNDGDLKLANSHFGSLFLKPANLPTLAALIEAARNHYGVQ